eukprot:m.63371 g.63371  ORF g.63371 m.63371 type:complete len:416 (-) comp11577_c0_seq3:37-1284(-)
MPVEIHARLLGDGVVFAGEDIECTIEFKNNSKSDKAEVAWATAQIHCTCSMTQARGPGTPEKRTTVQHTSQEYAYSPTRGERGTLQYQTPAQILFCDVVLNPNESRTFKYKGTIPFRAPPSYRGDAVAYTHKVAIGFQRVGEASELLRLPVRVLPLDATLLDACRRESAVVATENAKRRRESAVQLSDSGGSETPPIDPFLVREVSDGLLYSRETVIHAISSLARRKTPKTFKIGSANNNSVVRFHLAKPSFKIGEDIVGWFDFQGLSSPCYQVSVVLESIETFETPEKEDAPARESIKEYSKWSHFCRHLTSTTLTLPIPLKATPQFSTDIVQVEWRLSFEFVLECQNPVSEDPNTDIKENEQTDANLDDDDDVITCAPELIDVETLRWNLPISVLPTHPSNLPSQNLKTSYEF